MDGSNALRSSDDGAAAPMLLSAARRKVVEQIALTIRDKKLKTVALASTRFDRDVSALIRDVASVTGSAGVATLVIDLTGERGAVGGISNGARWMPRGNVTQAIRPIASGHGFDVVSCALGESARASFNDPRRVKEGLSVQFAGYDLVLLDLPGLLEQDNRHLNAVAVAAACEGVVLVCATGEELAGEISDAVSLVRAAGGTFMGSILDDRSNPTVAQEIGRFAVQRRSFARLLPRRVLAWLAKRSSMSIPIYS
jgi:hypothetical protein